MEKLNSKTILMSILFILLIVENIVLILFLIPLLNYPSDKPFSELILYNRVDVFRMERVNTEDRFSSATYISTLSEEMRKNTGEFPNPFAQPTPFHFNVKNHGMITLNILDSNKRYIREYKFPVHKGEYFFEWWAYLGDLKRGNYLFKFELPDTTVIQNVFKYP
jgi:hypothetical protein